MHSIYYLQIETFKRDAIKRFPKAVTQGESLHRQPMLFSSEGPLPLESSNRRDREEEEAKAIPSLCWLNECGNQQDKAAVSHKLVLHLLHKICTDF